MTVLSGLGEVITMVNWEMEQRWIDYTPVQVSGLTDITAISAGWIHTVALKNDGTVWAWGSNYYGELGDGTTMDRYTPVQVSGLTEVIAISAGDYAQ